ncbi:hypothetical protein ACFLWE_00940 [Chloroflexota bacterium]
MNQDKRLDKLEQSLTPKQAVIRWMLEAHQHQDLLNYVRSIRRQNILPLTCLSEQIDHTVRNSMKGYHKERIHAAVRRAILDATFLFHLHKHVNTGLMTEMRVWDPTRAFLAQRQHTMFVEGLFRTILVESADRVDWETSYPLDAETAAAVGHAVLHHVHTWESLEEDDTISGWLYDFLVSQEAKELPFGSYYYEDGLQHPQVTPENDEKLRACFSDEVEFEKFRTGQDYSYGLASVTDTEYSAHYDQMVAAIDKLLDSGKIQAGAVVPLETVPIPFLREAPLADGQWIDRYIIELAEWGALLQAEGYDLREAEVCNPLASAVFTWSDGQEANERETRAIRGKAARSLAKFTGKTKTIEGRVYLRFEDYCRWRKRKVREDLRSGVEKGLVTASWNKWVESQGGEGKALIAGVAARKLYSYVNDCSYHTSQDVATELKERKLLLDSLRTWQQKPERQARLLNDWKNGAEFFLGEVYVFQTALASISQRYFDGHEILFPDLVKEVASLVKETEEMVGEFNEECSGKLEEQAVVDLEAVRGGAVKEAAAKIAWMVDMAKAEALEDMGDQEAGFELVEKYL